MDFKQIAISVGISVFIFLCLNEDKQSADDHSLTVDIASLKKQISDLQSEQFETGLKVSQLVTKEAYFTPAEQGYSTIATPAGNLVVSLVDLQKYASGYKVFFHIGNPTLATFKDTKLTVKWNKEWDSKKVSWADWKSGERSTEIKIKEDILPARWNKVSAIISPAKAEDTAQIRIELNTDVISLMQPR